MVKSCGVISSGSTTTALLMIGLVCNKGFPGVNCAEPPVEESNMEGLINRRSPSPRPINDEFSRLEAGSEQNFDVPTLIQTVNGNDNRSYSSRSSSDCSLHSDIEEFYGGAVGMDRFQGSPSRLYNAFMSHMSSLPNLSIMFTDEVEEIPSIQVDYHGEDDSLKYESGEEESRTTEVNSDLIPSSSCDSNAKIIGGSKGSANNPKMIAITTEQDDSKQEPLQHVSIDEADLLEDNLDKFEVENLQNALMRSSISVSEMSDGEQAATAHNMSRVRSMSPYTRPSRASSIELDLATAAFTAASSITNINSSDPGSTTKLTETENQIKEELLEKITSDLISPLGEIDDYASDELRAHCDNVGIYILSHLSQQSAKMPTTPSTDLAYNLLEQLGRVFTILIGALTPKHCPLEYDQIIFKSLQVSIGKDLAEFSTFIIVRDALILLMMDYPDIFTEDFLSKKEVYLTLRAAVLRSYALKQYDTIDNIRLLLNFSNTFDMKKYLGLDINIPERKLSDEAYLPLMEVNLQKSGRSVGEDTGTGKLLKKPLRKKTKKNLNLASKPANLKRLDYSNNISFKIVNGIRIFLQFCWLNRVVIFQAILMAVFFQMFVFGK